MKDKLENGLYMVEITINALLIKGSEELNSLSFICEKSHNKDLITRVDL